MPRMKARTFRRMSPRGPTASNGNIQEAFLLILHSSFSGPCSRLLPDQGVHALAPLLGPMKSSRFGTLHPQARSPDGFSLTCQGRALQRCLHLGPLASLQLVLAAAQQAWKQPNILLPPTRQQLQHGRQDSGSTRIQTLRSLKSQHSSERKRFKSFAVMQAAPDAACLYHIGRLLAGTAAHTRTW